MKRFVGLLLAGMVVAGCGNKGANAPQGGTSSTSAGGMKIALLVSGPVSDHGWNGLANDAVLKLAQDIGAPKPTVQQVKSKGEIEAALRNFAANGYDLIVAHGNEYGAPAITVAKDFPKAHFVISSGRVQAPNVTSFVYKLEDGTYVLGVLAAGMSRTGKIACIGGQEFPPVASTFYGLQQGVQATKPADKVTVTYVGNWDDTGAAKQQATTLISQGNDILFHNADAAGLGVFQAVQEASKAGKPVYAFGSNADQTPIAPDVILASAVLDPSGPLEEVAKEVKENRFQGTKRMITMQNGGVTVAFNPALKSKIPAPVWKNVQTAMDSIKSGKLVVKQSG